ncbi:MAG: class I SAM-dependent methyltransferase [Pseudomonadota bacterium]
MSANATKAYISVLLLPRAILHYATEAMSRSKSQNRSAKADQRPRRPASQPVRPPAGQPASQPARQPTSTPLKAEPVQAPTFSRTGVDATARLPEAVPTILETQPDANYALIDSGNGQKLERYGPYRIVRPEAAALWSPLLPQKHWEAADAVFTGDTDEEGPGRWRFPRATLGETWPMRFDDIAFHGRFTSFRHVGVFPEQAAHWRWMVKRIKACKAQGHQPRILNLFGYTGLASLVAAHAGAEVTHVDASKKAIGWARENQALAKLDQKPIRWICDDAMKFVLREGRRGKTYDGILLDPPKYGRGPKGEVWQLFEQLPDMLSAVEAITDPKADFVVLTSYAVRQSFYGLHELMQEVYAPRGGHLASGELVLREETGGRALSTSLFSRWTLGPENE